MSTRSYRTARSIRDWRFDTVEVALISLLMLGIGDRLGTDRAQIPPATAQAINDMTAETRALEKTYGPQTNTEGQEEFVIRDFFKGKRDGVFVDVGANHYQKSSNTYYLETELGWSGIAIDPLKEFEAGYREHRPRTRFRAFFVSDASNEQAKMDLLRGNSLVTSSDKAFTERHGSNATELTASADTQNLYFRPLS